jgi:hypothetical protein
VLRELEAVLEKLTKLREAAEEPAKAVKVNPACIVHRASCVHPCVRRVDASSLQ